jgi:hypothetical protein
MTFMVALSRYSTRDESMVEIDQHFRRPPTSFRLELVWIAQFHVNFIWNLCMILDRPPVLDLDLNWQVVFLGVYNYFQGPTNLWTPRGFYAGRRETQALGCVSSSERSRDQSDQVRIFNPAYLTGAAIKNTWGNLGRQEEKELMYMTDLRLIYYV